MSKIDDLISFLEGFSDDEELFEQDTDSAAASTTTSSSASSGRSPKKWESGRTFGKTYMNDPKYKWVSGRAMGKTGGSDFA